MQDNVCMRHLRVIGPYMAVLSSTLVPIGSVAPNPKVLKFSLLKLRKLSKRSHNYGFGVRLKIRTYFGH